MVSHIDITHVKDHANQVGLHLGDSVFLMVQASGMWWNAIPPSVGDSVLQQQWQGQCRSQCS